MVMVMPMYSVGFALGPMVLSVLDHDNGHGIIAIVMALIFVISCMSFIYASINSK